MEKGRGKRNSRNAIVRPPPAHLTRGGEAEWQILIIFPLFALLFLATEVKGERKEEKRAVVEVWQRPLAPPVGRRR